MVDILKKAYIFSELADNELPVIAKNITLKKFRSSNRICSEGEYGEFFYIITKGCAKVSKVSVNGKELMLAILYSGDSFGEMSLFENIQRSADVTALEDTETVILTKKSLLESVQSTPSIAIKMLSVMSRKLRTANGQLESMVFYSLKERLIRLIISCCKQKNNNSHFIYPYSQTETAEILGVNRESISRIISELRKNNFINIEGRKLIVKDINILKNTL